MLKIPSGILNYLLPYLGLLIIIKAFFDDGILSFICSVLVWAVVLVGMLGPVIVVCMSTFFRQAIYFGAIQEPKTKDKYNLALSIFTGGLLGLLVVIVRLSSLFVVPIAAIFVKDVNKPLWGPFGFFYSNKNVSVETVPDTWWSKAKALYRIASTDTGFTMIFAKTVDTQVTSLKAVKEKPSNSKNPTKTEVEKTNLGTRFSFDSGVLFFRRYVELAISSGWRSSYKTADGRVVGVPFFSFNLTFI